MKESDKISEFIEDVNESLESKRNTSDFKNESDFAKPMATSIIAEVIQGKRSVNTFMSKISDIKGVGRELWRRIEPFATPLARILKFLWVLYLRRVYCRYAYSKDLDGKDVLSYNKASLTILSTFGCVVFLYFWLIPVVFYTAGIGIDTWKVISAKEETLYFSRPELNDSGDFYEVTGCSSLTQCKGGENARIFDIKDNNAMDIWYYLTLKGGFDPKDDVVSSFTGELNKCSVIRYRDSSFKFGSIKVHSEIISATCSPVVNSDG